MVRMQDHLVDGKSLFEVLKMTNEFFTHVWGVKVRSDEISAVKYALSRFFVILQYTLVSSS